MSFLFAFVFCTGMLADRLSKTPICIKFLTERSSLVELTLYEQFYALLLRGEMSLAAGYEGNREAYSLPQPAETKG